MHRRRTVSGILQDNRTTCRSLVCGEVIAWHVASSWGAPASRTLRSDSYVRVMPLTEAVVYQQIIVFNVHYVMPPLLATTKLQPYACL